MCLSAHPDDEDGQTLAYYAKLKGVKTYSVFFTRGEGGQNEIGSELYDDLGVIRTKETLAAAKILGSEVYFLGFPDFGYSKTAKETYKKWGGKENVIARLVNVIRALKPDVIITNHDTVTTKPNRQHGNHQAVGISVFEAYDKAADPAYHPEQLHDGVTPWQVKKLFYRFVQRDGMKKRDSLITIDISQRTKEGTSIEQIGMEALHKHRSQGLQRFTLDSIPSFFRQHYYVMIREHSSYPFDANDLFSGIMPSQRTTGTFDLPAATTTSISVKQPEHHENITTTFSAKNIFVGLVKTYDKTIEETLDSFKIKYHLLDSNSLANEELKKYNVILLDLRTYFYRHDAEKYNGRLLNYVKDGGNLISFYHKTGDWNDKHVSPYPLTLTNERVTEEDASVTILQPSHPLFTQPNKISPHDWDGWVQERSIYLPSGDTAKTSPRYERLLSMSDENDQQPSTSLLFAQYGKGTYTYCSLALYRQLRILNDGALKLFFNMISQPGH
jgi:LmbE family N-acetylglucosaminyl deacetylase